MELAPSQISKLVLGYLKAEKCRTAVDAFFNTSPHFRYMSLKSCVTRVHGYSLQDILNEYTQMYNLIQERLEPTSYYEENTSKNIIDQLTYLLDNGCHTRQSTPQRSMSSTPIKDINKKHFFQHNLSVIEENVSPELNTTPLEALPGNSQEFNNNKSNRRCGIKTNKNTLVKESDSDDNCEEDTEDLEVLRQTLLEHTELHEKIAENINLVIKTGENNVKSTEEKVCNELDSAIKAIVERTEADPMFEKLIGDLIGTTSENGEIDGIYSEQKQIESCSSQITSDVLRSSGNVSQNTGNVQQSSNTNMQETNKCNSESIKHRLRSPKKQADQNKGDVSSEAKAPAQEYLSVNKQIQTNDKPKPMEITTDVHKNLTVNTNTSDIILYDGTLDNYVKTSTPSTANTSNPILYNNSLLMVQPGLAIQQPAMAAPVLNTIQIDKQPYYLLNNSQLINVSVPQYNVNNVTEQDILNMPTVIVCDDNQQVLPNRTIKSTCSNDVKKILPKQTKESSIREYLTLYQCGNEQDVAKSQSKAQQKKPPKTPAIHIEILKPPSKADLRLPDLPDVNEVKTVITEKPSSPRPITPDPTNQITRKTTPKSGSHVRALDFNFSTPGHKRLSAKKMRTSSKSPKKNSPGKSSTKISKSLFGSSSKSVKVENGENKTEVNEIPNKTMTVKPKALKNNRSDSWDSDLRALAGPTKDTSVPRKKKKESGRRPAKKSKVNMNATETDAQAIEANLRDMDLEVGPSNIGEEVKEAVVDVVIKTENTKEEVKEEIPEEKVVTEDCQGSEFTMTLINCNAKSKFKRKCNIDNNISKAVKITKVKEIKSLELVPDGNNKLILSPSKLNANKRTLVENADKEINLVVANSADIIATLTHEVDLKPEVHEIPIEVCVKQDVVDSKPADEENVNVEATDKTYETEKKYDGTDAESGKFVTPEMPKISNPFPVSANRNLTPMLETPFKYLDTPMKLEELPKTPGTYTPNENSPMTKILNEQLQGVDLLSIQTPKFPLTPSFPITPFNSKSSYPHRSTDYSTASSYYQPSDSEQNKSLEAMIEECKRLSTKNPSPEKQESPECPAAVQNSISDKICSFNQSQIGRKNLSLVKKDLESSTSCESSSSDGETSSSSNDDSTSSESACNDSTIEKSESKKTKNPYMLRSRKKTESSSAKKTANSQDVIAQSKIKTELVQSSATTAKESILKEIEEKRKRTIAKFKEGEKPLPKKKCASPSKALLRNSSGRFVGVNTNKNSKSTATPRTKSSVNKRKTKSPIKLAQKLPVNTIAEEERNVTLHISSDDGEIKPFDVVETELLESSSSSFGHPLNTFQKKLDSIQLNMKTKESNDNISDQEAASLVAGLKERGIYLVPNKTPKKQEKPCHNINSIDTIENKPPVVETGEKSEEIQENQVKIEKKLKEVEPNQVVAAPKDTALRDDGGKLKEVPITEKNTEIIDVKPPTTENIQTIDAGVVEPDNKNATDSSIPKEANVKDNNKRKSTKPKSVRRTSSTDKKNQNKTVNTKIQSGASTIVKPKEVTAITTDLASCHKEKAHKVVSKLNNATSLEGGGILADGKNKNDQSDVKKRKPIAKTSSKSRSHERKTSGESKPRRPSVKKSENDTGKKLSSQDSTKKENDSGKLMQEVKQNKDERLGDSANVSNVLKASAVESQQIKDTPAQLSSVEHDLNLTDSLIDEVFDDKFYYEDTLRVVYDERNICGKSLKDYDLPISNKCFVVEVLGQQMEMSITPFETLLDIEEKKVGDKVKILQNMVISTGKKKKPLSILYGRLTESSNMKTISPLENLYGENSPMKLFSYNKGRKLYARKRINSVDQKIFEAKPGSKRDTRSKSLDCSSSKFVLEEEEEEECVQEESKIVKEASKGDELSQQSAKDAVKNRVASSHNTETPPREIDDELMNYAICGSERVENDSDDKTRGSKRKAKDEIDDSSAKKTKREEMLKDINVDMFLKQLHGDS